MPEAVSTLGHRIYLQAFCNPQAFPPERGDLEQLQKHEKDYFSISSNFRCFLIA